MIAVIVPVLNRPANAAKVAASLRAATTVPYELVFVLTRGDREQHIAVMQEAHYLNVRALTLDEPAGPGDFAAKTNLGFRWTDAPFVFTGADDLDFQPGWDTAALNAINGVVWETGEWSARINDLGGGPWHYGVCGTDDGANPAVKAGRHSTHSLIRRSYIDEHGGTFDGTPGVVFSEVYDHQCVELELLEVAKARGEYVHCAEARVLHRHPMFDRTVKRDATYEKALRNGRQDLVLFRERRAAWLREQARPESYA